jgi:hypothetical protein
MGTKKNETMRSIEQAQALMSAKGWRIDPWQVGKGDRLLIRAAMDGKEQWADVANVTTSAMEKRANVYVDGDAERTCYTIVARGDDEDLETTVLPWSVVLSHLRSSEIRTVPEGKKRTRDRSLVTSAKESDITPPGIAEGKLGTKEEKDPTDQGLTAPVSDDGPEVEEESEDGDQLEFPETLPSEDEARANVERLRAEWEEKRKEQEKQTPIAKKYATRLAKAKKAESLAYEGLVKARATLDRVVGFRAVRS